MRVIDILNKIANGEEVRFKIDGEEYHCFKYSNLWGEEEVRWYISEDWLNEEVEIIEEDKKIEKIRELKTFPSIDDEEYAYEDGRRDKNVLIHNQIEKLFIDKINEIIDYLNKEHE